MLHELPATDRPDDDVIDDDKACDDWFDHYTRRMAEEAQELMRLQAKNRPGSGHGPMRKGDMNVPQFGM